MATPDEMEAAAKRRLQADIGLARADRDAYRTLYYTERDRAKRVKAELDAALAALQRITDLCDEAEEAEAGQLRSPLVDAIRAETHRGD